MTSHPTAKTKPHTPPLVVAIVGTGTEIGKTWFATQLIAQFRQRGLVVSARKPVQSFAPPANGDTDADLLAAATGEPPETVCHPKHWYPMPLAPPIAADCLGRQRIEVSQLESWFNWPDSIDVAIVETVGGVRSPLSHDTDSAGLAHRLNATHAVLVADAGLGTINAVRLSATVLSPISTIVYLNRYDHSNLHRRNRDWLATRDHYRVATDVDAVADILLGQQVARRPSVSQYADDPRSLPAP